MGNVTRFIVALVVLSIINSAFTLAFKFFGIKEAIYVDFLRFGSLMILFFAILPDQQGLLFNKIQPILPKT